VYKWIGWCWTRKSTLKVVMPLSFQSASSYRQLKVAFMPQIDHAHYSWQNMKLTNIYNPPEACFTMSSIYRKYNAQFYAAYNFYYWLVRQREFVSATKNITTYEELKNFKVHIGNQGISEKSTTSILTWSQKMSLICRRAKSTDKWISKKPVPY
jgi:hypothetical protein